MQGKKTPVDTKEMALAMLRSGKTYREIGNTLDIGISTIHTIAKEMEEVDLDQIVKEIKRGFVARNLMLAEYFAEKLPYLIKSDTSIKEVAITMAILTDKAMKMEYTINEQKRPPVPLPQPIKPVTLAMDSTGRASAVSKPQGKQDKLIAEAHRLLEECHPPVD